MLQSNGAEPLAATGGKRRGGGLSQRWTDLLVGGVVVAMAAATPLASESEDEPIPTDVEERVEVRLAILDVISA